MKPEARILIYLIGSLGDTIVAVPAIRAVRRAFPRAELVLLQNDGADGLVKASEVLVGGSVDRVIAYRSDKRRFGRIVEILRLARMLRGEKFDAAVYAPLTERPPGSVGRDKLFFRFCGIKSLFGFNRIPEEVRLPKGPDGRPGATESEARRKLDRLATDGIAGAPEDLRIPLIEPGEHALRRMDAWLEENRARPDRPLVAVAPGCKGDANLWPLERFIEVGRLLLDSFDCELVVVGGPNERALGEAMIREWGTGLNAAGAFSVTESAALLSRCDHYIGLDTGTTHLAAAVGLNCFVIFGQRSNPGLWYPLGGGHTIVTNPVPCAGCRSLNCPVAGHPCMNDISVDLAWERLRASLADSLPARGVVAVSAGNRTLQNG